MTDAPTFSRERRLSLLGVVLVLTGMMVGLMLPVPYVIVSPGPLFNTLGDVNGEPVVSISGTQTYPTTGELDVTTVRERGGPYGPLTAFEAVMAYVREPAAVLPREMLFPGQESRQEAKQRGAADFDSAQANAVAAALAELGISTQEKPLVASIVSGGPAEGKIEPGDIVTAVNGVPVDSTTATVQAVRAVPPGGQVSLTVTRGKASKTVDVVAAPHPDNEKIGYVGITLQPRPEAPFDISFGLSGVGGPSAGLIFTLAVMDELTPEDLTGGAKIAGTGTMNPEGIVGDIGGVRQKMASARDAGVDLFLAPKGNCDEIVGHVPPDLEVVAVANLDEALAALAEHREGRPVAGCPAT